jgi:glycosyltransferase A (GT-A) superfamily protein (DUF2064 family)
MTLPIVRIAARKRKASRKPAAPFRCRLVIMGRVPVAGRVKTRLARGIGVSEAVRFYRSASGVVMRRLGGQPFWETIFAVTPDQDRWSRALPIHMARMGQGRGDLGARMQVPMRVLPPGPVCVIGTDIPGVTAGDVRRAFRELGRCGVVFGPAADGGFWLVGQRRRPRVISPYAGVRWSHAGTLAEVLANLEGTAVGFTTTLSDVDEPADLARAGLAAARVVRPAG